MDIKRFGNRQGKTMAEQRDVLKNQESEIQ